MRLPRALSGLDAHPPESLYARGVNQAAAPVALGDSHNFGRRVALREGLIEKPRALLWEWLFLSAKSPLRRFFVEAAAHDGQAQDPFSFLPDLAFSNPTSNEGGTVERIALTPLPSLSPAERRDLARIAGRTLALFSWLGVADLHWENLVLGLHASGQMVFTPLDIEMILADLRRPTETKLLPDADPEYAEICRHAAGLRRLLPYLGKPVDPTDLVAMASAYLQTLAFLDQHARAIADVFAALPTLGETPIRICLRGTEEYVHAERRSLWPPLLAEEMEQLARGDIPYFFRLYGKPGIHSFGNRELSQIKTLPLKGDVPQLDPILNIERGFRSKGRKALREEGLFTILGAFDHRSFSGKAESDGLAVTFRGRTLIVRFENGEELETSRQLRAFVGSLYLPCACGEVLSVFVPSTTQCTHAEGPKTA